MPEPGAGIRTDLKGCKRIVCLAANTMTTSCGIGRVLRGGS